MAKEKIIIAEEEIEEKGFKIFKEKEWTEEDIKKYLQRKAKLLRRTPLRADIERDKDGPRMRRVERMFDTYEHAILASGLELPPRPWSKYSDEELLEVARKWSNEHPDGKLSYFLLQNHPDLPSVHTITKRFGRICNYFEQAGVPYEDGTSPWAEGLGLSRPANLLYEEMYVKGC